MRAPRDPYPAAAHPGCGRGRLLPRVAAVIAAATLSLGASASQGSADLPPPTAGAVVLLHGLARGSTSMARMAGTLRAAGYRVCNVAYPSRQHTVEVLAERYVAPAVAECYPDPVEPIHFVTHSLGGIILRHLAADGAPIPIGRVVMLGPPNRGSEVVDVLREQWLFQALNGPAGSQLGTGAHALPEQLGPPPFAVGVIAGTRSVNGILSMLIPGPDDGKVAVERAGVDGMADFVVLPASHTFMMLDAAVLRQTKHFLAHGAFERRS